MMAKKKEMDNLAKDAARALAAGMSYGNWKALHPNTKDVVIEPKIPEEWRICKHCGKEFKPRNSRKQVYCEAGCQVAAQQERYRLKDRERSREYQRRKREERNLQHGNNQNQISSGC
jgi:hypothetical protein